MLVIVMPFRCIHLTPPLIRLVILFRILVLMPTLEFMRVFFFQAEDGIRDHCVTGVQTCALPISMFTRSNGTFISPFNLVNIALQMAAVGTIAVGVVFILLLGEIDLTVGIVSGLCAEIGRASCRERV